MSLNNCKFKLISIYFDKEFGILLNFFEFNVIKQL